MAKQKRVSMTLTEKEFEELSRVAQRKAIKPTVLAKSFMIEQLYREKSMFPVENERIYRQDGKEKRALSSLIETDAPQYGSTVLLGIDINPQEIVCNIHGKVQWKGTTFKCGECGIKYTLQSLLVREPGSECKCGCMLIPVPWRPKLKYSVEKLCPECFYS